MHTNFVTFWHPGQYCYWLSSIKWCFTTVGDAIMFISVCLESFEWVALGISGHRFKGMLQLNILSDIFFTFLWALLSGARKAGAVEFDICGLITKHIQVAAICPHAIPAVPPPPSNSQTHSDALYLKKKNRMDKGLSQWTVVSELLKSFRLCVLSLD